MKKFPLVVILFTIFAFTVTAQRSGGSRSGSTMVGSSTAVYSGTERPRVVSNSRVKASAGSLQAAEHDTFDLVNEEREKRGLRPLVWSDDAARAARLHSRNMAQKNFFSHQGQDGLMVNDRAEQVGIFNWRAIGENIAFNRGYDDPVGLAVQKWLESPSHRENMLNKTWIETGIGVAVSRDGSYYFTQVFILRK